MFRAFGNYPKVHLATDQGPVKFACLKNNVNINVLPENSTLRFLIVNQLKLGETEGTPFALSPYLTINGRQMTPESTDQAAIWIPNGQTYALSTNKRGEPIKSDQITHFDMRGGEAYLQFAWRGEVSRWQRFVWQSVFLLSDPWFFRFMTNEQLDNYCRSQRTSISAVYSWTPERGRIKLPRTTL